MTRRIGILGGTFDPVHVGHLAFAEAAREQCGLERVLFMPACVPVYKKDKRVTPAWDRLAMVALAVADNPAFEASALELERGGDTYTADTLRALREALPDDTEMWFLVGADAAATVPKWRESQVIADLAHLAVAHRPGAEWPRDVSPDGLDGRFRTQLVEVPQLDVSSSAIREAASRGRSIRYLVPEPVRDYIESRALYAL